MNGYWDDLFDRLSGWQGTVAVQTQTWVGRISGTLPHGDAVIDHKIVTALNHETLGFTRLYGLAVHGFG